MWASCWTHRKGYQRIIKIEGQLWVHVESPAVLLESLRCHRVRSTVDPLEAVEAVAAEGAEAPGKELVTEKAEKVLERDGEDWELGKEKSGFPVQSEPSSFKKWSNIKTDYCIFIL